MNFFKTYRRNNRGANHLSNPTGGRDTRTDAIVKRIAASVFLAALFTLIFIAGATAIEGRPVKTVLDNGLTVIIEEEHSAPVVSVQMWVRVGSADESEREAGLSHVFEHMLFKGTERRKVGEIAGIVESVGGDINAYTSFDNTVYHVTIPSRHYLTGIDIIGDAIQHSAFDPDELKKELQVVLEEINMNEDSPGRKLYKAALSTAYAVHPYKRPVIGYEDVVKGLTRDGILVFFKKWYIPNNMTLVIAGDVDSAAALRAVKNEFKDFKKGKDPHTRRPVEPEQREPRRKIFAQDIKQGHLALAFHTPELKDKETFAVDVASVMLGGGESSRLYKKLRMESPIVNSISAYPMPLKDPGVELIIAALDPKNLEKTITLALDEIARLGTVGPDNAELRKTIFNLESEFIYSRETMDGIASKLGFYETHLRDVNYRQKYLEGIRNVTTEDVRRVVKRYFNPDGVTVVAVLPRDAKEALPPDAIENAIKESEKHVRTFAARNVTEDNITKVKLENGITLVVKETHSNPTVAVYAAFPGGLRFEDAAHNGIGGFTAAMLTKGTVKVTREELADLTDEMAGEIGGFSGWNSTGVSGKFLSMHADKALAILADVIMNPSFPATEIENQRKDTLAAIARQEDNLPSYTFKLLYRTLYKEHPYGMPSVGTKDTVNALTREDLVKHHRAFFTPDKMVLTVVGDVNAATVTERVNALFKDFKQSDAAAAAPAAERHQDAIRSVTEIKNKAQTNVGIGFLGVSIADPDSYALKVLSEVLAGQGGRLFLNLRDKQSLAYSLSAFSKEGKDPGVFALYIASSPDKKEKAISGLLDELKIVSSEKVTDKELMRAKNAIIGGYEIGLQEVSSQASEIANDELYGLGYGYSKVFPAKIDAVTADDVLKAAKKYLTLDAYTISIVGPADKTGNTDMKQQGAQPVN